MRLYHFTWAGAREAIGDAGEIVPGAFWGHVWMTHDRRATRAALGLEKVELPYDRAEFCYEIVAPRGAVPWSSSALRSRLSSGLVWSLETAPGARPGLWWVSPSAQNGRLIEVPA